jgi:hypothetical protein
MSPIRQPRVESSFNALNVHYNALRDPASFKWNAPGALPITASPNGSSGFPSRARACATRNLTIHLPKRCVFLLNDLRQLFWKMTRRLICMAQVSTRAFHSQDQEAGARHIPFAPSWASSCGAASGPSYLALFANLWVDFFQTPSLQVRQAFQGKLGMCRTHPQNGIPQTVIRSSCGFKILCK